MIFKLLYITHKNGRRIQNLQHFFHRSMIDRSIIYYYLLFDHHIINPRAESGEEEGRREKRREREWRFSSPFFFIINILLLCYFFFYIFLLFYYYFGSTNYRWEASPFGDGITTHLNIVYIRCIVHCGSCIHFYVQCQTAIE